MSQEPPPQPALAMGSWQPPNVQIFVETMAGETISLYVRPADTICNIKLKIQFLNGTCVRQQRLLIDVHHLEDGRTVKDHNILDGSRLRLVLVLLEGT